MVGLSLDTSTENLIQLYLSTIQSIGYGTKQIIEEMNKKGYNINEIYLVGGLSNNEIFSQQIANITNMNVYLSVNENNDNNVMLIGSALLGAIASKEHKNLFEGF